MDPDSVHIVPIQENDADISITTPLLWQENHKHDEANQEYSRTKDLEGQIPSDKRGASFARTCLNLTNAVSGSSSSSHFIFFY
jgi:hypothetical protein